MNHYTVRKATAADFPRLRDIEISAGRTFLGTDRAWVADDPPPSIEALQAHLDHDALWVIAEGEHVLGYLAGETHGELAVIHQVSVDFDHQRRGLGSRLIAAACEAARAAGATRMGLTTYRDLPWNAPYYARFGFREVRGDDIPAPLVAMLANEAADGHDPARRCAMVVPLATWRNAP